MFSRNGSALEGLETRRRDVDRLIPFPAVDAPVRGDDFRREVVRGLGRFILQVEAMFCGTILGIWLARAAGLLSS